MTFRGDGMLRHVPIWLIASRASKIIERLNRQCLYSLSGIISNLGRVDLDAFQGGGFQSNAFWAIPPRDEYHPFFLVLAGHGDTLELILSVPRQLADRSALDHILGRITQGLKENEEGESVDHELLKTSVPY